MDGIIETIEAMYNPTDDLGNVTAVDMNLLCIIKKLLAKVNELEQRIDRLENPSEYDALMLKEMANRR